MLDSDVVVQANPVRPIAITQQERLATFEQKRLDRRRALAKFGLGLLSGTIVALSTDDIARLAVRALSRESHDKGLTESIAREFNNAGVAFAASRKPCSACGSGVHGCGNAYCQYRQNCFTDYICGNAIAGFIPNIPAYNSCLDRAKDSYKGCADPSCSSNPVDCSCNTIYDCTQLSIVWSIFSPQPGNPNSSPTPTPTPSPTPTPTPGPTATPAPTPIPPASSC